MSAFSEQLDADIDNVFFNLDEFAQPHRINDKSGVACIFDTGNEPIQSGFKRYDGTEKATATLYVREADMTDNSDIRALITVDGVQYRIAGKSSDNGILGLTLEAAT
jgi:hypothetical protein